MKRSLLDSTTFKFCLLVLLVGAAVAQFHTGENSITWAVWFDKAVYFVGIFATKEGIRYGAAAYKSRPAMRQSDGIKKNDN